MLSAPSGLQTGVCVLEGCEKVAFFIISDGRVCRFHKSNSFHGRYADFFQGIKKPLKLTWQIS